jgi:hypothetical protein
MDRRPGAAADLSRRRTGAGTTCALLSDGHWRAERGADMWDFIFFTGSPQVGKSPAIA